MTAGGGHLQRARAFLWNPYHYLALPLIALLLLWPGLSETLAGNALWTASFDYSSAVFPVTYAASLAVLALFLLAGRQRLGLGRAAFYGLGIAVGSIGLFELVFDEFFPNTFYPGKFAMFAFVLFGLTSVRSWRAHWAELPLTLGWITLFFAWVFVHPAVPVSRSDLVPLTFNIMTKIGAFLVFGTPLFLGIRQPPGPPLRSQVPRGGRR